MPEHKHTPGPWSFWQGAGVADEHHAEVTASGGEIVIAEFNDMIQEGIFNARLIAAAPDLLKALEDIVRHVERLGRHSAVYDKARAAIAKATGQA